MILDSSKQFSLQSPYFDKMRKELDAYISKAFSIMDKKEMNASKISLTIDIITDKAQVNDERAPLGVREAVLPRIDYKIGFRTEAKAEHKDAVGGAGHEVVRDDYGNYYVLSKEEASGQMSIFNGFDEVDKEFPEEDEE